MDFGLTIPKTSQHCIRMLAQRRRRRSQSDLRIAPFDRRINNLDFSTRGMLHCLDHVASENMLMVKSLLDVAYSSIWTPATFEDVLPFLCGLGLCLLAYQSLKFVPILHSKRVRFEPGI